MTMTTTFARVQDYYVPEDLRLAATDLMTEAPSEVDQKQLNELNLRVQTHSHIIEETPGQA